MQERLSKSVSENPTSREQGAQVTTIAFPGTEWVSSDQGGACLPALWELCMREFLFLPVETSALVRGTDRLEEVLVKRERLTQVALLLVGLFNLALIRFLYRDLWQSNWLLEGKNEIQPMFLSVFITIGLFLLIAVRRPSQHRSMIALIGWWNIAHSTVMMVETVQTYRHNIHRNYDDVILFYVIGIVLLVLLPTKSKPVATATG